MPKPEDYLNPEQRKYYQEMKRTAERTLKNLPKAEYHAVRNADKSLIKKNIKRAEKVLDERTPPKLKGKAKDKVYREYKELREQLKHELLGKRDMHPTKTVNGVIVADMDKARQMAAAQVKRIEGGQDDKIRRMRNLGRLLDADDPGIGNAEQLRRR